MHAQPQPLTDHYIDPQIVPALLARDSVRAVKIFALGPAGTNMQQASQEWIRATDIAAKADITLCATPEDSIEQALSVTDPGVVPIFALCAVYFDLCKVYFTYGTNYTFLSHLYMPLDSMQLASRYDSLDELPPNATVATHYSPAPLLDGTSYQRRLVDSNAEAARQCASGETDACITTETARKLHGLKRNFLFGSPPMLFTFGTTLHGVDVLKRVMAQEGDLVR